MRSLDNAELRYLAGLFDGDGSLTLSDYRNRKVPGRAPSYAPRVRVTNCERELLFPFKSSFGGSIYRMPPVEGKRQGYQWEISGKRAYRFVEIIAPHLRSPRKTQIAALIIHFGENKTNTTKKQRFVPEGERQWRDSVFQNIKALNVRGA